MKTKHIVILVILGLIGLAIIYNNLILPEKPISFEQVGYYKSDDNIRYFTFYVKSLEPINKESIPDELFSAIESHGKSRMHTSGKLTGSLYYLSRNQTPDITTFPDRMHAEDFAFEKDPIAVVWINTDGSKTLIKRPETGW